MAEGCGLVIGVAGRIGSGKSEVAQCLRDRFGFQYLRYSLVLAEWYHADPSAKARLQELGWDVMSGDRQRELNRRLIGTIDPNADCVVDGLRHPIDYESLRDEYSERFSMIFVETPSEVRFERLRGRFESYQTFEAADSHPVESKIELLKPFAATVLPGELPIEQLEPGIGKFVEELRSGRAV